jgi:hypothetical protein
VSPTGFGSWIVRRESFEVAFGWFITRSCTASDPLRNPAQESLITQTLCHPGRPGATPICQALRETTSWLRSADQPGSDAPPAWFFPLATCLVKRKTH